MWTVAPASGGPPRRQGIALWLRLRDRRKVSSRFTAMADTGRMSFLFVPELFHVADQRKVKTLRRSAGLLDHETLAVM